MCGEHACHKGREGFERVEVGRLVGHNMLHPSCKEPLCYVCFSVELHDKRAAAGQRRLILCSHLTFAFLTFLVVSNRKLLLGLEVYVRKIRTPEAQVLKKG
jgi:hypothetical protein